VLVKDEWNSKAARKLNQDEKKAQVAVTGNERLLQLFEHERGYSWTATTSQGMQAVLCPRSSSHLGEGCPCLSHPKTLKGARDAGSDFVPAPLKMLTNMGKFLENKT